jgi:hypothetical protein
MHSFQSQFQIGTTKPTNVWRELGPLSPALASIRPQATYQSFPLDTMRTSAEQPLSGATSAPEPVQGISQGLSFPSYSSGPFGQSLSTPKRDLIPMSFSGPSLTSPAVDHMDIDTRIASIIKRNTPAKPSLVEDQPGPGPSLAREQQLASSSYPKPVIGRMASLHLAAVEEKAQEEAEAGAGAVGLRRSSRTRVSKHSSLSEDALSRAGSATSSPARARPGGKAKQKTAPNLVATIFSRPPPMTDEVSLIFADHDRRLAEREQLYEDGYAGSYLYGYPVEDEEDERALHLMHAAYLEEVADEAPATAAPLSEVGDYEDSDDEAELASIRSKFIVTRPSSSPMRAAPVTPAPDRDCEKNKETRENPQASGRCDSTPRRNNNSKEHNQRKSNHVPAPALAEQAASKPLEWPAKVNPNLVHWFSPEAASRVVNGRYQMTAEEERVFKERSRNRESKVISIDQRDYATALRLFSRDYMNVITPSSVLADTGADVGICISESIATKLGLTWTPGSSPLSGIGGVGANESRADQDIVMRMGGDGRETDLGTSPEQGCFTLTLRPIIMSPETVRSIGHKCIIGQGVLWRGLASFDQLNETMDISPAYPSSGCAEFRVSIPCFMTRRKSSLVALMIGHDEQRPMEDYLPPPPPSRMVSVAYPTSPRGDAAAQRPTFSNLKAATGEAVQAVSKAIAGLLPRASKPRSRGFPPRRVDKEVSRIGFMDPFTKGKTAAPLHPGFPQSELPPTREQYRARREETASRNAAAKAESYELRASAADFTPAGRSYKDALDRNPSGASPIARALDAAIVAATETAVQKVMTQEESKRRQMQAEFDKRFKALEEEVAALNRGVVPSRSAPLETLNRSVRPIEVPLDQAPPPKAERYSSSGASGSEIKQEATDPTPAEAYRPREKKKEEEVPSTATSESDPDFKRAFEESWTEVVSKKQRRKNRQRPPPAPSTHPMATRRSGGSGAQPQGGQVATVQEVPTVNPRGAHIPVNPESWNRLKGKSRLFASTSSTVPMVGAVLCLVPQAMAQPTQSFPPLPYLGALDDEGFFWTQVAAALVIWVVYTLGKHLTRDNPKAGRLLRASIALAASLWFRQVVGAQAPVAALWQQAIKQGIAAPLFYTLLAVSAMAVARWSRLERSLFRKARRL